MRSPLALTAGTLFFILQLFNISAATPASSKPTSQAASGPSADTIIHSFADELANTKSFKVEMRSYLKMTAQGKDRELSADYNGILKRPNRFALIQKGGSGSLSMYCDGKKFTIEVPQLKKYTETDAPEKITNEWLNQMQENSPFLQSNPVHGIFLSLISDNPYEQIMKDVTSTQDLGSETIEGASARHIHGIEADMEWDMWIAEDQPKLPIKLSIDVSKSLPEQAQQQKVAIVMQVMMKNWQTEADVADQIFQFTPAADENKVESFFEDQEEEVSPLIGKPAPPVKLDLLNGGNMTLAQHKGKDVVIMDLWATWCPPCREGLPIVSKVAADYKNKNVVFYAVNEQEDAATVKKFLADNKLKINVAMDKDGEVGKAYGAESIPRTIIIDKDGVVQVVHVGFSPSLEKTLRANLDAILAGKKPAEQIAPKPSGNGAAKPAQ